MKILWLTNIMPQPVSDYLKINPNSAGGWITGLYNELMKNPEIEFIFCFPNNKDGIEGKLNNGCFHGFCMKRLKYRRYSKELEDYFSVVIEKEKPDVIHLFGSEYPYHLALVNAAVQGNMKSKLVLSIQGLIGVYANQLYADLPRAVVYSFSIGDFLRRNNIFLQKKEFEKRGQYEVKTLENVQYILGRTDWDYAYCSQLNIEKKYVHCGEILRGSFYSGEWRYEQCTKNQIFLSQANYPIKGLHKLLEALKIIVKQFPETMVKIAGENILEKNKKIKYKTSYSNYISKMIRQHNLSKNITFIGTLDEHQIKREFLESNVYISPSSIENSSNSVGEALSLGVPIVASDVGGMSSLIRHDYSGYLYPFNESNMLAYYVCKVFNMKEEIERISANARFSAKQLYSRENIGDTVMKIYNEIGKG